jgi:fatty-acyl-CoA synthase
LPSTPAAPADRPHFKFWPKRVPREVVVPDTTLWDNLEVSARRYPSKAAFVFMGRELSFAEVLRDSLALAGWLQRVAGVKRSDRVLLMAQNSVQFVVGYYAILRCAAAVVPVNPMNKAAELAHYITDPQASVALCAADLAPELLAANATLAEGERLKHLVAGCYADYAGPDEVPAAWASWFHTKAAAGTHECGCAVTPWADALGKNLAPGEFEGQADDMAVLPYTSGTTGLPKGCIHTHKTIAHNCIGGSVWSNASASQVSLAVVPMFHITGMQYGLHAPIWLGATAVILPRWDRELAGRTIGRYRVSSWTMIPTMIIDLLASPNAASFDLTSLQYIGGGGAAMPAAVAERLFEQYGLRFSEGYGLTETAAPSHSNPPDAPKLQCLGIPYVGTDARVVNPDTLQEVPVGETGEIIMRGPQNFKGYWRNPEATQAAFVQFEGETFFRSGDLGRMDEDGYFFITDRLKRMINASGFKVWPAEVEALLFRHPAIQEACIIATHDAYRGESVKACVVLKPGATATADEIMAWCRENMAAYKVPRSVAFLDALPKSGSGKVMWRLLQEKERVG